MTADNWDGGVQPDPIDDRAAVLAGLRSKKPYPHADLELQPPLDAYGSVLANAGATLPRRDAVDRRIIEMVRTGKATAKASTNAAQELGGVGFSQGLIEEIVGMVSLGIITDPAQVGGYPDYRGTPYPDTDHDGMPNDWETRHGLNPRDPADASADANGDGYTNIEDFINGLDPTAPKRAWPAPRAYVDLWKTDEQLRERLAR